MLPEEKTDETNRSSEQERMADALAPGAEEGRG